MDNAEVEYLARKLEVARAKSILAIIEMSNEAKRASVAMDEFGEALIVYEVRLVKRIYDAWITLPNRKDNLN